MRKEKRSALLLMVLLLLIGITALYVASTYAKYTAEVTGQGTAQVAKWAFKTDNASTDFEIKLDETYDPSTLVAKRIAPGTSGKFDIKLSNKNSEVGVNFTIAFTDTTNVPQNLVFKQGSTEINPSTGTVTGHIAAGEELTVPLTWEWKYYTSDANDAKDTTDGETPKTMTVKATITGVQTTPNTTAITTGIN